MKNKIIPVHPVFLAGQWQLAYKHLRLQAYNSSPVICLAPISILIFK